MAEKLQAVPAGPLEVLELALCVAAKQGAFEALAGRRATPAQLQRIAAEFTREVHSSTALLAREPLVSDRDLVLAARATGQAAVIRVLGPLPAEERH